MSSDTGDWPIYLIIIVIFIFNGLIAASKRALDYLDRNKIKDLLNDDPDNRKIRAVMDLQKKPSLYQYADLVMSTLSLIACAVFLNYALYYAHIGSKWLIISNVALYFLYLGLADMLPKKLAAQSSERYAIRLAGFQRFIYYITLPIVMLCTLLANIVLFLMRKETDVDDTYFSEDKVMSMLDQGQETGDIKEEGRKMIDSIFEFDDLLAYEIMTPRTDVFTIDLQDDKEEYFEQLMELRYSRIPVCDGDADNIIGILHIKDYLLKASTVGFDNVDIKEIMREPYYAPETKNIDSLFVELQVTKQHLAILIDEYGGFSGLVSIEDIIEQIVGDIDDEFDEEDRVIEKIDDRTYVVDGNVYLDDLDEETGIELESENSETIGGFLIDIMGEIPKEDIQYSPIKFENYLFTILQVKDRRIEKIKITVEDEPDTDEEKESNER